MCFQEKASLGGAHCSRNASSGKIKAQEGALVLVEIAPDLEFISCPSA
jgi:hypothetical protein